MTAFTPKNMARLILVFYLSILSISIFFLIYSAYWTTKPGPTVYYSPFWTIVISSCLVFQTLQNLGMMLTRSQQSRVCKIVRLGDTIVSLLTGFISGVCLVIASKSDTAALSFLTAFIGLCGVCWFWFCRNGKMHHIDTASVFENRFWSSRSKVAETTVSEASEPTATSARRPRGFLLKRLFSWINVFLIVIHACVLILCTVGSVEAAISISYTNPGTIVKVTLPTGQVRAINYYCTTINHTNPNTPTIWFESSSAHGILDFLGVQTILANRYNRKSCSYDPPNFGWSDALPASLQDYDSYFSPLLHALQQESAPRVLVGWGEGARYALLHTLEHANTTTDLVIMDASPDGIEWQDAQRANNWSEKQMLAYRQRDLHSRISLCKLILSIGIPWGLIPLFIPSNPTAYFSPSLYTSYRTQTLKENLWTSQFYFLTSMATQPILNDYLTSTPAPLDTNIHALMTYNSGYDNASNLFYRQQKMNMLGRIAGKKVEEDEVVWCDDETCSLDFPVDMAVWTADALMGLGI